MSFHFFKSSISGNPRERERERERVEKSKLSKFLFNLGSALIVGISVGAIVMAFNNPPGNPTTGGGIIGVGSGAPAGSLYINSSGNVGIGTTNPSALFSVGSNSQFQIDSLARMINTGQPAFLVSAGTQNDIATDGYVTLIFGSEVYDQGNNFASNTFIAPVTGKYQFSASITLTQIDSAVTHYYLILRTSNRDYSMLFDTQKFSADLIAWTFSLNVLADMDAGDTAYLAFYQTSGTQQVDLYSYSWFSGFLAL